MKPIQELIDEIEKEQKEMAIYKKIGSNTLKQWSKYGIEPYFEENKKEVKK